MQFQATCSKGNKKLTLSLSAPTLNDARKILHEQGYSIIEIHEVIESDLLNNGNFFYFDTIINGSLQSGKIQSDDIFKAYRKLVEDLKYDVQYIYNIEGMPEDQKKVITAKVKDGYNMYLESIGATKKEEQKEKNKDELMQFSPEILKELEKYTKFIDDTITQIQNLLIKHHAIITPEQKSTLERMESELVQVKGIRNVGRMQSVLEGVLTQKGMVEIEILKKTAVKEKSKFLEETNALLKGIGKKEVQTEEQKKQSIEYQVKNFFTNIFASKKSDSTPTQEKKVDKQSFIYFKNKRELDIYKKAMNKNDTLLLKTLFSFQFAQFKRLLLKRKLLVQNIQIISNRLENKSVSYTKIVHGFDYYINALFGFFESTGIILVSALFLYAIFYIIVAIFADFGIVFVQMEAKPILGLVIFALFSTSILFVRGWKTLIIFSAIFFFVTSFLIVNF